MTDFNGLPFVTISSRQPSVDNGFSSGDSAYGSSLGESKPPSATHDISRADYHVKDLSSFAKALEDSATKAFPNLGGSQRYRKVVVLLLHWDSDDLFVLPEVEDLERCFREDYNFETEMFTIPSGNAHLDLMLKVGALIKDHESTDTLLIVYYGGHAKIDDARQSTWCASRNVDSPWLQWSAIQTLLERSLSDTLILLDCCAGAASAAFPTGTSITETISASSWDAIAPDPGRYSFTSTLLEVLLEWKWKTYSVAMLHAEILARLKHPRPERRNGGRFEVRTTPVHFMMTANHKAPSIELCRVSDDPLPISPPSLSTSGRSSLIESRNGTDEIMGSEPNENVPHVMISLALEGEQNLNVDDWEHWLSTIPALAKYVKVQGVFKSHSTLILASMPVMIWDMLPDHRACNFIAFIRSNNLATKRQWQGPWDIDIPNTATSDLQEHDHMSIYSGTTTVTTDLADSSANLNWPGMDLSYQNLDKLKDRWPGIRSDTVPGTRPPRMSNVQGGRQPSIRRDSGHTSKQVSPRLKQATTPQLAPEKGEQQPSRPVLPPHAENRLEEYFINNNTKPTVAVKEFLASNLSIEATDIDRWFHHRREQQAVSNSLQSLRMGGQSHNHRPKDGARMILPGHLSKLLEIFPTGQIVVIDLRTRDSYQVSHIHGAINFRAPASFVRRASMEMIEKTLADEASRSSFDKWYTSKCVVFYDKVIEYPWEAPVADALFQKFRSKHWPGQCFILKGHYREFSQSFDRYIVGANTTDKATEYLASLQDVSWEKSKDDHQRYDDWLKLLDDEDRVHTTEPSSAIKSERLEVVEEQQRVLESEFARAFPHLQREAQARQPDDNWALKAPMVAHLELGIAKMQYEAGLSHPNTLSSIDEKTYGSSGSGLPQYTRYPDKANDARTEEHGHQKVNDGYDYHYRDHQHPGGWQGTATPLHKSSSSSTLKGKSTDTPNTDNMGNLAKASTAGSCATSVPIDKKTRFSSSAGKTLFTRIIRSGRPDTPSSQ